MDRSAGDGTENRRIGYQPLPSQAAFHNSAARFKGYSGPIGSGKSQALCQEALRMAYLNPGRLGLIGAPTYPMLRDATQRTLLDVLDEKRIPYELNKAENSLIFADTKSKVVFRSVDDFERLRGTNLAWFGIDELTYTPEEAWLRLQGRLRDPQARHLCGFAVWTPRGYDWVYERFLSERADGYFTVIAKPFENHHLLDKVPDFYERLKDSYDARLYQQEVLGEYLNLNSGKVYHAFERNSNVREVTVDPRRPLLWALDFNVDPMSAVIAQRGGETISVLDEIVLSRASTYEACEEFRTRFPYHPAGLVVYADATGARMQTAGTSDLDIIRQFLRQNGYEKVQFRVPKANPRVLDRVALVNAKLKSASEESHLAVSPKCKELIKDFEQVGFKDESAVIDKDRDPKRTHLSDALGYLVWQECRKSPPVGERSDNSFP